MNFYKSFSKNILLYMSRRLSKIRSVHTYVMPRTVYFGWICMKYFGFIKDIFFSFNWKFTNLFKIKSGRFFSPSDKYYRKDFTFETIWINKLDLFYKIVSSWDLVWGVDGIFDTFYDFLVTDFLFQTGKFHWS